MVEAIRSATLFVGASSAIAMATMRRLDAAGALLVGHHREGAAKLEAFVGELQRAKLVAVAADLGREEDTLALADRVEAILRDHRLDALDGIVFAAAPAPATERFTKKAWSSYATQLDVQVRAPALLLARLLPPMAARKRGRVVFVSSSYTIDKPPPGLADYVIAKHAQLGLMRALAAEYAAKNLQINAVSPSMVETPFLRDVPRIAVEMVADKHPLKRNATPEDVAPLIAFLLSDGAGYVNGANIPITGL